MVSSKDPVAPKAAARNEGEMTEDEIDQNLVDTFPASDPPSWTLGTYHAEKLEKASDEADETEAD